MARFVFKRGRMVNNPVGAHVTWSVAGRKNLAEVTGVRYDSAHGRFMLQSMYMNGETAPEVCAGVVNVLERTYEGGPT